MIAEKKTPQKINDGGGVGPNVVVGIMITNRNDYYDALQAQTETWLKGIAKERTFVVGPLDTRGQPERRSGLPRFVPSPCVDQELWCKRLEHVVEAGRLLDQGVDFDWLWSGNEDWYVDVEAFSDVLANVKRGPDEAVVYTGIGCSQWWKYHENSKGDTLPKPDGYVEYESCQILKEKGGVCGGFGIVFSRKAVQIMMRDGSAALYERTLSLPFKWDTLPQGDPVLSCVVYSLFDGEIDFEAQPWKATDAGAGVMSAVKPIKEEKKCPRCRVASFHASGKPAADNLRKIHNIKMGIV